MKLLTTTHIPLTFDDGLAYGSQSFDIEAKGDDGQDLYVSFFASISYEYEDTPETLYSPVSRAIRNFRKHVSQINVRDENSNPVEFNYNEIECLIKKELTYE